MFTATGIRSSLFATALLALALCAGSASAQTITRKATGDSLASTSTSGNGLVAAPDTGIKSGPTTPVEEDGSFEYVDRPRFFWVVIADDFLYDLPFQPTNSGYGRSVQLHIQAFYGGISVTPKLRIQGYTDEGQLRFVRDERVPSGSTVPLVHPGLHNRDAYLPTTFIISSNEPLVLTGRVVSTEWTRLNDSRSRSESSRTLDFQAVDCTRPGNEWVCSRWSTFHSWDDFADADFGELIDD